MVEDTPISAAEQLCDETKGWLQKQGYQSLGDLTDLSEGALSALPEFENDFLWEIQDALESRGLKLRADPPPVFDAKLGVLTLDEWVRRLAQTCPHTRALTSEQVRATMQKHMFDMSEFEGTLPPSHYKYVLYALAEQQCDWLYASDWKGPRDDAARAFESLLALPANHLSPERDEPLSIVAEDANGAAHQLGTTEARLHDLAPYDDYCVFACMTKELRDALIAAFVLVPTSPQDYQTRGEGPLTLTPATVLYEVQAFADDAHNFFQNMAIQTVGELMGRSGSECRRLSRIPGVVDHIEGVLMRAELHLAD